MAEIVRPYFLKRVCIFGPESCGKSTLAQNLALYYQTSWVPEYARSYLELQKRDPVEEDMTLIAKGQASSERSLAEQANRILFTDTDPLTTRIWSEWLFERCAPEILSLIDEHTYDLYLLLTPDTNWEDDAIRYFPEQRWTFYEHCQRQLKEYNRRYLSISGDWNMRWSKATKAIDSLLAD
mgnify:CR=1 FL=1